MAVIFYLSSEPEPLPELTAAVWDKALHFLEYAGLAVLLGRAFRGEGIARPARLPRRGGRRQSLRSQR